MSTSSKKKVTQKSGEPKAKYSNGSKVFICCYVFSGPGLVMEGEVRSVVTTTTPVLSENGKITGNDFQFKYLINTAKGEFEMYEYNIFPSYAEAAKYFTQQFKVLLK